MRSRSRKDTKARKERHGTRKHGARKHGARKHGARKDGGMVGEFNLDWSPEETATLQFLNEWDEEASQTMVEDFLTSLNWDEEKVTAYPGVYFGSDLVYQLIKEDPKFIQMAKAVCDKDVDLHQLWPNLRNNTSLCYQLGKYILQENSCEQAFIWQRMKKPPVESPFVENLHQINVILHQFAIENFQDIDILRKKHLDMAITHLKDLETALENQTFQGDVNAKLLDSLNQLILHLPIRKWHNNLKRYCSKLPLERCDQDYQCKLKTTLLGRKKCGLKPESFEEYIPHLKV